MDTLQGGLTVLGFTRIDWRGRSTMESGLTAKSIISMEAPLIIELKI